MRQKRGTPGHKTLLTQLIDGRVAAGLTQVELAEKLQVRQSYVSNYETGERRLDVVELILVCEAIALNPAEVVRRVAKIVATTPPLVLGPKRAIRKTKKTRLRKGPRPRRE